MPGFSALGPLPIIRQSRYATSPDSPSARDRPLGHDSLEVLATRARHGPTPGNLAPVAAGRQVRPGDRYREHAAAHQIAGELRPFSAHGRTVVQAAEREDAAVPVARLERARRRDRALGDLQHAAARAPDRQAL